MMLTTPAPVTVPTESNGAPTARSAKPSALKSPAASPVANWSPCSAWSLIPRLSWVQNWLPVVARPFAVPYRTLTPPASTTVPTSSMAAPMARSANPSPLKSVTGAGDGTPDRSAEMCADPNVATVRDWPIARALPPNWKAATNATRAMTSRRMEVLLWVRGARNRGATLDPHPSLGNRYSAQLQHLLHRAQTPFCRPVVIMVRACRLRVGSVVVRRVRMAV